MSIDNRELFFTICANENGYKNCDIYYTKKKYEDWSELKRLKYPINKSDSWESQPTFLPMEIRLFLAVLEKEG